YYGRYLALAAGNDCRLVAADRRLHDTCPAGGWARSSPGQVDAEGGSDSELGGTLDVAACRVGSRRGLPIRLQLVGRSKAGGSSRCRRATSAYEEAVGLWQREPAPGLALSPQATPDRPPSKLMATPA